MKYELELGLGSGGGLGCWWELGWSWAEAGLNLGWSWVRAGVRVRREQARGEQAWGKPP